MIKSFYTIGNVLRKDEAYAEYFEPWSNPFPKVKDDEAKVIIASIKQGELQEDLKEENFSKQRVNSYLYRPIQGKNGTNLVPTLLLQIDRNFEKYSDNVRKLSKKIKHSVKNNKHSFINLKEIDVIEQKLLHYHQFINFDKRYLFTVKIDEKYFGDFENNKILFEKEAYSKYYKDSSAKNKVCAVTYKQSEEVWGRVDTLGFTVDAMTFSRNGFEPKDSYKMFPVSPDAVKVLEGAKRIILESDLNLTRNFYGLKYFISPHFLNNDDEITREVLKIFIKKSNAAQSFGGEGNSIINNERIINEIIKDEILSKGDIYYDIFFYQPNNAQFLIKLHLSDVLPSRFKEIFDAKKRIEDKYQPINRIVIKSKDKKLDVVPRDFKINFGGLFEQKMPPMHGIKDYFSQKVSTDTIFHPYFYKVLEAVFYGTNLNKETVLKAFMEKIVIAFKNIKDNPNDFTRHVKTSFTIYQFFNELKLFNSNIMDEKNIDSDEVAMNIDNFVNQHDDFFKDEVKKGAFYLGLLTNIFLEKQNSHLQNKPFMNQLNGLNLDSDQMQKIHLKLIDKLYQYNDKLKKIEHQMIEKLNPLISKNLILRSDISRTELSYAFALGMTMQKEFFLHNQVLNNSNTNIK